MDFCATTSSAIYRHMMNLPLRVHRVGEFQYRYVLTPLPLPFHSPSISTVYTVPVQGTVYLDYTTYCCRRRLNVPGCDWINSALVNLRAGPRLRQCTGTSHCTNPVYPRSQCTASVYRYVPVYQPSVPLVLVRWSGVAVVA